MKKFFGEFKKFITKGNVVDMAVGVIIGSSFTAIVNAVSNNVLKPLINFVLAKIFNADSLKDVYTMLKEGYDEAGMLDLSQSIYIDWGALINAVINFFLIALVLFCIVRCINHVREGNKRIADSFPTKEERIEMKKRGIRLKDKHAVAMFLEEKEREAEEAKKAAEEKARREKEENPSTEELLKQIRDLLAAK